MTYIIHISAVCSLFIRCCRVVHCMNEYVSLDKFCGYWLYSENNKNFHHKQKAISKTFLKQQTHSVLYYAIYWCNVMHTIIITDPLVSQMAILLFAQSVSLDNSYSLRIKHILIFHARPYHFQHSALIVSVYTAKIRWVRAMWDYTQAHNLLVSFTSNGR